MFGRSGAVMGNELGGEGPTQLGPAPHLPNCWLLATQFPVNPSMRLR
jgi:hypothetical protein